MVGLPLKSCQKRRSATVVFKKRRERDIGLIDRNDEKGHIRIQSSNVGLGAILAPKILNYSFIIETMVENWSNFDLSTSEHVAKLKSEAAAEAICHGWQHWDFRRPSPNSTRQKRGSSLVTSDSRHKFSVELQSDS
uniref:Uncharacterized protein n=1 Tax=Romanomermis culicivorax TaxID=13658 RepID=A0A915L5W2_ROMCU